jgi:hypothetical protein
MFVSVGSSQMPGGQFLQMGEAPSSFVRADIDLSASVAIGNDNGGGGGEPYFDGYEVELSSGAFLE